MIPELLEELQGKLIFWKSGMEGKPISWYPGRELICSTSPAQTPEQCVTRILAQTASSVTAVSVKPTTDAVVILSLLNPIPLSCEHAILDWPEQYIEDKIDRSQ